MAETKKIKLAVNHNVLPPEMLVKILKLLNYKDLCKAQLICKRWNEIIGKLKKKASGKILEKLKKVEYELKAYEV